MRTLPATPRPPGPPGDSPDRLFRSFWMGGYEGADHVNSHGVETLVNRANQHWDQLDADYGRLAEFGLRTVRESIGWRASTGPDGRPDFTRLVDAARTATRHGLQVIWTIHHYGVPDGVDLFSPDMPHRFADFCEAAARALDGTMDGPPIYQPVNEISFLTWAAAHSTLIHPYLGDAGPRVHELKRNLVRAALRGCDALWSVDPQARIVHTDPVIHVIASGHADPDARWHAQVLLDSQYEAFDMLCGRRDPDLGGAPRYLDVLGLNYYHGNQWEHPTNDRLHWHLADPRRRDLADLIADVGERYGRPIVIAETGHVGDGRAVWLDEVAEAALRCRERGIALEGICLYPLIDRPDWEESQRWHRSGLWDVVPRAGSTIPSQRVLNGPYAARLRHWLDVFEALEPGGARAGPERKQSLQIGSQSSSSEGVAARGAGAVPADPSVDGPAGPCLVVFSHLRWDSVFQRPQQLMSRLARRFPIVFVEEPVLHAPLAALERLRPLEGVEVLRPHVTGGSPGFHDDHIPALRALLANYLRQRGIDDYWFWFYTPLAMPLAAGLAPGGVVYDCIDQLSAFRFAPRQLGQRENALLKWADLVFTAGPSLFESRRTRHPRVSCFPNSVDVRDFVGEAAHDTDAPSAPDADDAPVGGAAESDDSPAVPSLHVDHPAQATIGHPRLGYVGVVDERIDLGLVAAIADARPEWQIVVVGPLMKIDEATVPRRANLHWLGPREHGELPALLAGWDVGLMPFASNESTRFINPTKTLEYLAAGLPVVSTPVPDVAAQYGHVVAVASPATFVEACDAALGRTADARAAHRHAVADVLAATSWDRTAGAMGELIGEIRASRRQASGAGASGSGPGDARVAGATANATR